MKKLFLYLLISLQAGFNSSNTLSSSFKGDWKYIKDFSIISIYGDTQLNYIKSSTLHIYKKKIYFDYPANQIIDTCYFSKITIQNYGNYIDRLGFVDERLLSIVYSKKELSDIEMIELNCKNTFLGKMYLKQDTLILNCGGILIFMLKKR
jgi:hypothetical protein